MSSTDEMKTSEKSPEVHDVPLRGVLWFVAIFIAFVIVTHIGLWILYRGLITRDARMDVQNSALVGDRPAPPEPRLQPSLPHNVFPKQDLVLLRQSEDNEFAKRGWKTESGEVQIPEAIVAQVAAMSATQPAGGSK